MEPFAISTFRSMAPIAERRNFTVPKDRLEFLALMRALPKGSHSFKRIGNMVYYETPPVYNDTLLWGILNDGSILKTKREWSETLDISADDETPLRFSQWLASVWRDGMRPKIPIKKPLETIPEKTKNRHDDAVKALAKYIPSAAAKKYLEHRDVWSLVQNHYLRDAKGGDNVKLSTELIEINAILERFLEREEEDVSYREVVAERQRDNALINIANDRAQRFYEYNLKVYNEVLRVTMQYFEDWQAANVRGQQRGDDALFQ